MATYTANYNFKKPDAYDFYGIADFNSNADLIDEAITAARAADVQIATGSYVGTGTYGENNPNTVHIPFVPKFFYVYPEKGGDCCFPWAFGSSSFFNFHPSTLKKISVVSSGQTFSWYASSASDQFNSGPTINSSGQVIIEATKYIWIAFG